MGKIRHVAFMINEPLKVMDFYQRGFGFEQCYASASGSVMVTDGLFNLALLKIRESDSEVVGTHRADGGEANQRPGINHYGFVVDSVEETLELLGPELKHGENPQDGRPAEMRVYDPWDNAFDLSSRGYFGREEKNLPGVRHLVVQADRPNEVADFYKANLELAEEGTSPDGSVLLGDGYISMSLTQEGLTAKQGIQAIGIQVDDWAALAERFKEMGTPLPERRSKDAEVVVRDPEGNLLLVSERGWER
jgi:catechol 2,3-dioxygenase-like lactoylglutathione lyase family enzyme